MTTAAERFPHRPAISVLLLGERFDWGRSAATATIIFGAIFGAIVLRWA
jgi:hypothetical protein